MLHPLLIFYFVIPFNALKIGVHNRAQNDRWITWPSTKHIGTDKAVGFSGTEDTGNATRFREDRLPNNGHIAILLRGQAFRNGRLTMGCNDAAIYDQLRATKSLLTHIVDPLEQNHNTVEFFIVNGNSKDACPNFEALVMSKFGNRVKSVMQYNSEDQPDNIRKALEQFKYKAGGLDNITKRYDLIMIVRHDSEWLTSVNTWPTAEFDKFNFFSLCEEQGSFGGPKEHCVNDNFHMMPGSLWKAFESTVGTEHCFNAAFRHGSGHGCYPALASRIGENHIAFITDWRPPHRVRDPNNISNLT